MSYELASGQRYEFPYGVQELDLNVLDAMDDKTLFDTCSTNTLVNRLCNNEGFWKRRSERTHPLLLKYRSKYLTWKAFYRNILDDIIYAVIELDSNTDFVTSTQTAYYRILDMIEDMEGHRDINGFIDALNLLVTIMFKGESLQIVNNRFVVNDNDILIRVSESSIRNIRPNIIVPNINDYPAVSSTILLECHFQLGDSGKDNIIFSGIDFQDEFYVEDFTNSALEKVMYQLNRTTKRKTTIDGRQLFVEHRIDILPEARVTIPDADISYPIDIFEYGFVIYPWNHSIFIMKISDHPDGPGSFLLFEIDKIISPLTPPVVIIQLADSLVGQPLENIAKILSG